MDVQQQTATEKARELIRFIECWEAELAPDAKRLRWALLIVRCRAAATLKAIDSYGREKIGIG